MSLDGVATNIREYNEEMCVEIGTDDFDTHIDGRDVTYNDVLVIQAQNESGYNSTCVDLLDVLKWVIENRPELINKVGWKLEKITHLCLGGDGAGAYTDREYKEKFGDEPITCSG